MGAFALRDKNASDAHIIQFRDQSGIGQQPIICLLPEVDADEVGVVHLLIRAILLDDENSDPLFVDEVQVPRCQFFKRFDDPHMVSASSFGGEPPSQSIIAKCKQTKNREIFCCKEKKPRSFLILRRLLGFFWCSLFGLIIFQGSRA
ncbi:hypothetical protein SDC9_147813 [bioreactor metagenome]|uniref:Uncharacterized protein n=1 Tax=bioreactor metagenome TaxID=1076179 RepID=A0A645EFU1_9ZZZZ